MLFWRGIFNWVPAGKPTVWLKRLMFQCCPSIWKKRLVPFMQDVGGKSALTLARSQLKTIQICSVHFGHLWKHWQCYITDQDVKQFIGKYPCNTCWQASSIPPHPVITSILNFASSANRNDMHIRDTIMNTRYRHGAIIVYTHLTAARYAYQTMLTLLTLTLFTSLLAAIMGIALVQPWWMNWTAFHSDIQSNINTYDIGIGRSSLDSLM